MMKTTADPGGEAWSRLLAVQATLVERIEAELSAAGLPALTWYDALWALERADEGRLRMHELARSVVLSRSNVTRLIDRLEEAGLIARENCADDRRGAFAAITAKGREMRKRMWVVYRVQIRDLFFAHLSASDARAMKASLDKVLAASRAGDVVG